MVKNDPCVIMARWWEYSQNMDRERVIFDSSSEDLITTPLVTDNDGTGISNISSSSLVGGRTRGNGSSGGSGSGVQGAVRYLRRAGSRGLNRQPSRQVRESATAHLEERQNDWAYSRPVVLLDLLWNLAFLLVATAVVILSRDERPEVPLRLWIVGYALQCIVHMLCVSLEYRRRRQRRAAAPSDTPVETSLSHDSMQAVDSAGGENADTRCFNSCQFMRETCALYKCSLQFASNSTGKFQILFKCSKFSWQWWFSPFGTRDAFKLQLLHLSQWKS